MIPQPDRKKRETSRVHFLVGGIFTAALALLILAGIVLAPSTGVWAKASAPAADQMLYLPVLIKAGPFTPSGDTTLKGGSYSFTSMIIPAGVTVTVTGDVAIDVNGDAQISGKLTGDCTGIAMDVSGAYSQEGQVTNICSTEPTDAPGVTVIADGGTMVGSTSSSKNITGTMAVLSDGEIFFADSATENAADDPIGLIDGEDTLRAILAADAPAAPNGPGVTINAPMQSGPGKRLKVFRDGPITINANLTAGNGKDAPAKVQAGTCTNDEKGGKGGTIMVGARGNNALTIGAGVTLRAGDGGKGGSCNAPSGCPATATAGKGGLGGSVLVGGQTVNFGAGVKLHRGSGGPGGDSTAKGDDGAAACDDGCDATATGGLGGSRGGVGYVLLSPGTINGAPTEDGANGGKGGAATATGGDGQDCDTCPGGAGGKGGAATATGGKGGDGANGKIWALAATAGLKGDGGDATAAGGVGGKGASCCGPDKFGPHLKGGDGGNGGAATSTGGQIGDKGLNGGGKRGASKGGGGNAGDGGDGEPPGAGGKGGVGTGDPDAIPDGADGKDGAPCPKLTIWFIYHSSLDDGPIAPGSTFGLVTYLTKTADIVSQTGVVTAHFMTDPEYQMYGNSVQPVQYVKNDPWLQVFPGGIQYDLSSIPPSQFPTIGVDATVTHDCVVVDCVRVLGFFEGDMVGQVGNETINTTEPETLHLPPPEGAPYYDSFILIGDVSFTFDHWWIIIIDP